MLQRREVKNFVWPDGAKVLYSRVLNYWFAVYECTIFFTVNIKYCRNWKTWNFFKLKVSLKTLYSHTVKSYSQIKANTQKLLFYYRIHIKTIY